MRPGFSLAPHIEGLDTMGRMSVGERIIADLRRAVFAHVLTLTPTYFDAARTGEISSRLTNDTEQIRQVIGFGLSMFLRNLLMMTGAPGCRSVPSQAADPQWFTTAVPHRSMLEASCSTAARSRRAVHTMRAAPRRLAT